MARYLIGLEKEDDHPKYITHEKGHFHRFMYLDDEYDDDDDDDFSPYNAHRRLFDKEKEYLKLKRLTGGYDEEGDNNYWFDKYEAVEVSTLSKDGQELTFKILEADTWPSAVSLGLDSSQYRALQAALTKELVVIQGPPGTGKTFMALKIAEILIKNKSEMGRCTPILVVCLTNHALDQFLVEMMQFTENIVRIGGQSKRPELGAMNLKNKHMFRSKKQHLMIVEYRRMLNVLHYNLDKVEQKLFAVEKGLSKEGIVFLPGTDLKNVLLSGLMGAYLCWFLNLDVGFIAFADVRKCIQEWKIAETRNISENKSSGGASAQQDIDQNAYYLEAELDFLETNIRLYDSSKQGAPAAKGERQKQRIFQMSVEEKLKYYFLVLDEQRNKLAAEKLKLTSEASKVAQFLDEVRWMEQIQVLQDQDVIGLTTTGAARLQKMLSTIGCEIGNLFPCLFILYTKSINKLFFSDC